MQEILTGMYSTIATTIAFADGFKLLPVAVGAHATVKLLQDRCPARTGRKTPPCLTRMPKARSWQPALHFKSKI